MSAPTGLAQIAAVRTVVGVDESVLRPFSIALAEGLAVDPIVELPLSLDALMVRARLQGAGDLTRVGELLHGAGLTEDQHDVWLDSAVLMAGRPLTLAITAGQRTGLRSGALRIGGGWSMGELYRLLGELGVSEAARRAWDRLSGALLTDQFPMLDLGYSGAGLNVSVHIEHAVPPAEVERWTAQLAYVMDQVGVPEAQRQWMQHLFPALCTRHHNPFVWTLHLNKDAVEPRMAIEMPRVPSTVVLKHALDIYPDVDQLGMRFGAAMGASDPGEDAVSRWRIELGEPGPELWVRP